MGEFDEISYSKANKATSQLAEMSKQNTMGAWELLETITVPAGGVASIERTKDTENVDYTLRGVYITADVKLAGAQESLYVDYYNKATSIISLSAYKGITTAQNYACYGVTIKNGYWTAETFQAGFLTSYGNIQGYPGNELSRPAVTYPCIDKVRIYAQTTVIPAGSVIKIYGVRC